MGPPSEQSSLPSSGADNAKILNDANDETGLKAAVDIESLSHNGNGSTSSGIKPPPLFADPRVEAASVFLRKAIESGKLGSGPAEGDDVHRRLFRTLLQTFPWVTLLVQLLWTAAVMTASYFLSASMHDEDSRDLLESAFWTSRLNVSSTVASGVGWALFVLLGFYIREASNRYVDAQFAISRVGVALRRAAVMVRQAYERNVWHDGDMDRMLAHMVAYPIALKMALRGEKEPEQLYPILDRRDADDVVAADPPHLHCIRVPTAYITTAEDDGYGFSRLRTNTAPAGSTGRAIVISAMDSIGSHANAAMRIAHFHPAVGYINHLRIFLYIWLMFLPLTLVQSSGLFTILWSLLITYGVAMIFNHAHALNQPFGYDQQDIKLNRLCAKLAHDILLDSFRSRVERSDVIDVEHETPRWLEGGSENEEGQLLNKAMNQKSKRKVVSRFRQNVPVLIAMALLVLWCAFAVFFTRNRRTGDTDAAPRWWDLYIPLQNETTAYISLGVFILLGFWINDAYGRYWRALNLWQTEIKPKSIKYALEMSLMCRHGALHQRDRERFISFFVALPYASMLHLRGSRDVSVLEGILSPKDLTALAEAPDFHIHIIHVIFAYLLAYDKQEAPDFDDFTSKIGCVLYSMEERMRALEYSVAECDAIRKFPISPTFTLHLQLFTGFWIALLPFSYVIFHGYFTFLYVLLIGYSIINLLRIGGALADPFGDDADDLPLESFSAEVRDEVRRLYPSMARDSHHYVRAAPYNRADLTPKLEDLPIQNHPMHEEQITMLDTFKKVVRALPKVPLVPLIFAILWIIGAVFLSWGVSKIGAWGDKRNGDCREWCSPIDVDPSVLGNVGFALFMILAFRASDAIQRYDNGAMVLTKLQKNLRTLALEIVQTYESGTFHPNDKERIVAHIAQIPLTFRDLLLERWGTSSAGTDGVLCKEDHKLLEESSRPVHHLLYTVESYCLAHDIPNPADTNTTKTIELPLKGPVFIMRRINGIHALVEEAFCVKRFSVVQSYRKHQYKFTILWLALLPLSMTPQTGFFTILWASLIAYGVLGMEEIAIRLVDPYGTDAMDLPVQEMCENASAQILGAVHAVGWSSDGSIGRSDPEKSGGLSAVLRGNHIMYKYPLASINQFAERASETRDKRTSLEFTQEQFVRRFNGPRQRRAKPTLFAHVLHSVPWWALLAVTVWAAVACIISYLTRDKGAERSTYRWWTSFISISDSVGIYISIAAFALLSFYVSAAYSRYITAGQIWGDILRSYCHSGASDLLCLWPRDEIHRGDHVRVIGHLAAIPLVLKAELRRSRDVREIKGLVSSQDIGRIQCAESMSGHCIDVIRSYLLELASSRLLAVNKNLGLGLNRFLVLGDIRGLEGCAASVLHLEAFGIAPGFIAILQGLLTIWFIILPFILAEASGWFTILWVPIISYGVLGMYSLAAELQHPFGNDLNDLDIDHMADKVVADVLDVYRMQPKGPRSLVRATPTVSPVWTDETAAICTTNREAKSNAQGNLSSLQQFGQGVGLAARAVPWWVLVSVAIWSAIAVGVAKVVGNEFWSMKFKGDNNLCAPWFCSPIAVNDAVKEYAGFALFLLLAFRLTDSHSRYVQALQKWQESIAGATRLICGRTFQGYRPNVLHGGDFERIAGHLAAIPITLMGSLRHRDYTAELEKLLDPSDVRRILSTIDRPDYCIDVVRSYFYVGEQRYSDIDIQVRCPYYDLAYALFYLIDLNRSAIDCKAIARTPMPFGYVQHFRIFLIIWLLLLPLGLVESSGWVTILWVVIIAYGIIGVERWAEELSDPFGFDVSDIPLEKLCDDLFKAIKGDLHLLRNGVDAFMEADRAPFPDMIEDARSTSRTVGNNGKNPAS